MKNTTRTAFVLLALLALGLVAPSVTPVARAQLHAVDNSNLATLFNGSTNSTMTGTTVLTSPTINVSINNASKGVSVQLTWTSTPVGTFALFGSNDVTNLGWVDVTSLFSPLPTNPAGAAGSWLGVGSYFGFKYFKVTYTNSSSTGTLRGNVTW